MHAGKSSDRPWSHQVVTLTLYKHARLTGDLSTNKKHAIHRYSYKLSYHPEIITEISVAAVSMH